MTDEEKSAYINAAMFEAGNRLADQFKADGLSSADLVFTGYGMAIHFACCYGITDPEAIKRGLKALIDDCLQAGNWPPVRPVQ